MLQNDKVIFQFTGPMGVRVDIGQSLAMLVVLLVFLSSGDLAGRLIFVALLIIAIFLHELGHAWGCVVQRVPVRRIMLHGGGGFCESARSQTRSQQELIVAMGPLVNLGLWALASLAEWAMWNNVTATASPMYFQTAYYLSVFAYLNLTLFIFSLIPVQPLDGGKLFHLAALRILDAGTAQRLTGMIGLVLSIVWIPAMIYIYVTYGWLLFFIPSIPAHLRMARGQLV